VEVAVLPSPPPATGRSLVRDAILDLLGALGAGAGLILLSALIIGGGLVFVGLDPQRMADNLSPWAIAGLLLATQLPLIYFALRRRRRNREKGRPVMELFSGAGFNAIPIGVFAGLGLTVLSAVYTGFLQRLLGEGAVESQVEFLQRVLDNKPAVTLLVLLIAGMAPVCEELFFRGVIFGSARAAGLNNVGVALSAVLFASVHVSLLLAPFYLIFAVVMCWLYARTGTLAAPIAAHATLNSVACAALIFAGNRV
jgi:membrane protease YdiL (CAAX protease family)